MIESGAKEQKFRRIDSRFWLSPVLNGAPCVHFDQYLETANVSIESLSNSVCVSFVSETWMKIYHGSDGNRTSLQCGQAALHLL